MRTILAFLCLAFFAVPAHAGECPGNSLDDLRAALAQMSGSIIGGAVYDGGDATTTIIIYRVMGQVLVAGFKEGCAVMQPLLLEVVPEGKPAKPTPSKSERAI